MEDSSEHEFSSHSDGEVTVSNRSSFTRRGSVQDTSFSQLEPADTAIYFEEWDEGDSADDDDDDVLGHLHTPIRAGNSFNNDRTFALGSSSESGGDEGDRLLIPVSQSVPDDSVIIDIDYRNAEPVSDNEDPLDFADTEVRSVSRQSSPRGGGWNDDDEDIELFSMNNSFHAGYQGVAVNNDEVRRAYDKLAWLIPPYTQYTKEDYTVGLVSFVVAVIASINGARFGGTFAESLSEYFSWDAAAPIAIGIATSLIVNIPVLTRSVVGTYYTFKSLRERWDPDRLRLPDDDRIKNTLLLIGGVSILAAVPSVVFLNESLPQNFYYWLPSFAVLGTVYLITNAALSARALTSAFNFDTQKSQSVIGSRRQTLELLRNLMTPDARRQLMDYKLDLMARGQTAEPYSQSSVWLRKKLAFLAKLVVGPYGAVFGYAVFLRLSVYLLGSTAGACHPPIQLDGGLWSTLAIMGIVVTEIISGSVRYFLLANSNARLVERIFSYRDIFLFKLGDYEVQTSSINNPAARKFWNGLSLVISSGIALLSMGSPSAIPQKYFFCDQKGITLLYSLLIGTAGAYGINSSDLNDFMNTFAGEIKRRIETGRAMNDPSLRFGINLDQLLLNAMYRLTIMSSDEYARRFLVPFEVSFKGDTAAANKKGLSDAQNQGIPLLKALGMWGNYADGIKQRETKDSVRVLERGHHPQLLSQWMGDQRNHPHYLGGISRRRGNVVRDEPIVDGNSFGRVPSQDRYLFESGSEEDDTASNDLN